MPVTTEKLTKHKGALSILYPHDLRSKITPSSIIMFRNFDGTFHQNMKVFLTIIQVFALMPVNCIWAPTANALSYSFCSFRNWYAITIISLNLTYAGIILFWNIRTGLSFYKMFPLIWFTINPFVMFQFIRIASKWSDIMRHWESIETTITCRDISIHRQMRKVIYAVSIGVPALALIEHGFSLGNNVNTASLCKSQADAASAYFTGAFPAFFHFFKVSYISGIGIQCLNVYTTFTWSMADAFIILVSLGLITQFRHFNKHFERFKGMHQPQDFWAKQRLYFTQLIDLLDHVNNEVSMLILTSIAANVFYICVQLYESISISESTLRRIYFWYSLFYLIAKVLLVSMVATLINDEANKPIKVLESLPAAVYGSEAVRFMHQLTSGTIALGGMRFFYITRTFLISITGTIVTYELVLIQFKKAPFEDYDPCEG